MHDQSRFPPRDIQVPDRDFRFAKWLLCAEQIDSVCAWVPCRSGAFRVVLTQVTCLEGNVRLPRSVTDPSNCSKDCRPRFLVQDYSGGAGNDCKCF